MSRCPEDQKIVVRGLPSGIDQQDVEAYFNRIGRVADIWLKDTGRDTFGFIGFEAKADYEEALRRDGKELDGHVLRIEPKGAPRGGGAGGSGGARGGRDANKIYVRGLGDASDADIRAFFEKVGPITDYYRRDGADFCFVGFENAGDYARALRMSGEELSGNRIKVEQKGGRDGGRDNGRKERDGFVQRDRRDERRDSRRRRRSSTPRRPQRDSRSPPRRPQRDSRSPPRRPRRDERETSRSARDRSRSPRRHHRSSS